MLRWLYLKLGNKEQGCGVWVVRSRRFLGGVGFLTPLGVGVRFFCPTPKDQLDHVLHHTPKLGIAVEMEQFLIKLLLKQIIIAVYHDFHWLLVATKFLAAKLYSLYVKESESGIGAGHFTSDSATLIKSALIPTECAKYGVKSQKKHFALNKYSHKVLSADVLLLLQGLAGWCWIFLLRDAGGWRHYWTTYVLGYVLLGQNNMRRWNSSGT